MRRGLSSLSLFALSAAIANPAFAQQTDAQETEVSPTGPTEVTRTNTYDAAFFAPSAPQTALDIARLVPGFDSISAMSTVRGFAEAAGNVVINGAAAQLQVGKLTAVLRNIPASRVVPCRSWPGRPLRRRIFDQEPGAECHPVGRRAGSTAMSPARYGGSIPAGSFPTPRHRR